MWTGSAKNEKEENEIADKLGGVREMPKALKVFIRALELAGDEDDIATELAFNLRAFQQRHSLLGGDLEEGCVTGSQEQGTSEQPRVIKSQPFEQRVEMVKQNAHGTSTSNDFQRQKQQGIIRHPQLRVGTTSQSRD